MRLLTKVTKLMGEPARRRRRSVAEPPRRGHFEAMEPRLLLAADPLVVGAVYIEQDIGSDVHGDAFEITFEGGAAQTQLSRIEINTDQFQPGFSLGDAFFDIAETGYGADHAAAFSLVLLRTADPNATVTASVQDGGTLLVLELSGFQAGDKLVFEIDVDEAQSFTPGSGDLDWINEGFDPITSGIEFQGSRLSAFFSAPHYHDAQSVTEFRNQYDKYLTGTNLDLPADDYGDRRDRTAGAVGHAQQEPLPVSIAGTVFLDSDLDLVQDPAETGLSGVTLDLWMLEGGQYRATPHSTVTDGNGNYQFGTDLDLRPGSYQVRQTQPPELFSVGAIPGSVGGQPNGLTVDGDPDVLTAIALPLGDLHAVDMDFAEAEPASLSGYVYHDRDNDGLRDTGEEGIANVEVRIVPIQTIAAQSPISIQTSPDGFYQFTGLAPGQYEAIQVQQPTGYLDGLDTAGLVDGRPVGAAVNPGDHIGSIALLGGQAGSEYNFGELVAASIQGNVCLSDPHGDCYTQGEQLRPVADAVVRLLDSSGVQIAETLTDQHGDYRFDGLWPGTYTVVEVTPVELIDGADHIGTIDGNPVGQLAQNDTITGIVIASSQQGLGYDFCEHLPASLAGFVYHDRDNDGLKEPGEEGIQGVTVRLLDASGAIVSATYTDAAGRYEFPRLDAGDYVILEQQPDGWEDGLDAAGTVGGTTVGNAVNPSDRIEGVQLKRGDDGLDFNFGEFRYAAIAGSVHLTGPEGDCFTPDGDQPPLSGVTVSLQDGQGNTIRQQTTDQWGQYRFEGLIPGVYAVVEQTPEGLIDGSERVGTVDGSPVGRLDGNDRIQDIALTSDQQAVNYDFCEHLPASLAGFVYHDANRNGRCDAAESPIAGVTLTLRNVAGESQTVVTGQDGRYEFTSLSAGVYSIVETQPQGFLDGLDTAGSLGGTAVNPGDEIREIPVLWGNQGAGYDFGEFLDGSISGMVHTDLNGDCIVDPDELPLAGVAIQLLDADGEILLTTHTGTDGRYRFDGLAPGEYAVREQQPEGYLRGGQRIGSGGGDNSVRDVISRIPLTSGVDLNDYDFCEVPPASISGTVYSDPDADCVQDADEQPLAGVVMELLDASGHVQASTTTGADGSYQFTGLAPGMYSVRQQQPVGFFDGSQRVGTRGGSVDVANLIADILIPAGDALEHYDFCERPPGVLSGFVFIDGQPLWTDDGLPPKPLRIHRDGVRTDDDTPISGVVLQLRHSRTGQPVMADHALPGIYPDGPVTAVTDHNGYYEFRGLPAGEYAVYEDQPADCIDCIDCIDCFDGIDTPGDTGGFVVDEDQGDVPAHLMEQVAAAGNDAIFDIPLQYGGASRENNFSEVQVQPIPPEQERPPEVPPTPLVPSIPPPPATPLISGPAPQWRLEFPVYGRGGRDEFSWHLSVIDAGMPRGNTSYIAMNSNVRRSASLLMDSPNWQGGELRGATWLLPGQTQPMEGAVRSDRAIVFGRRDAIPVAGDFNGDGIDEIGVYYRGRWFLDMNGNGIWDDEDLWARLGGDADLPVTGDWNGDGKDDIGIFGPEWEGDYRASATDPGLPDMHNPIVPLANPKNIPPNHEHATTGVRVMQNTARGNLRADVIDHVFRYGAGIHLPVAGDWSGDGIKNIGLFHQGTWRLDMDGDGRWSDRDQIVKYGQHGDLPVVGDFNGDGVSELGVFRGGQWIIDINGNHELDAPDKQFTLGQPGDKPVVGDWDGDGVDDPAVYREGPEANETPEVAAESSETKER